MQATTELCELYEQVLINKKKEKQQTTFTLSPYPLKGEWEKLDNK